MDSLAGRGYSVWILRYLTVVALLLDRDIQIGSRAQRMGTLGCYKQPLKTPPLISSLGNSLRKSDFGGNENNPGHLCL
jgi:hypothetical protein